MSGPFPSPALPFRPPLSRVVRLSILAWLSTLLAALGLVSCSSPNRAKPEAAVANPPKLSPQTQKPAPIFPVMLGIDTLESEGFAAVKGRKIGLLTHPAGVNRHGVSTVEILHKAPGVDLVCLFAGEHGIYGEFPADQKFPDKVDPRTGLVVHSLYNGASSRPTAAQLKGLDALVIDLQDIASRTYTFISAMKVCMEACFENNVEVIILDRPNPLGGLKVDGPPLDPEQMSYVGEFRVPYVHGLTMGELARMAKEAPGVLKVSEEVRARGRLTIVPMSGWKRSMRWPETGLAWIPTSPHMPDFSAVEGYPMVGLGTYIPGTFYHGIGTQYPFRGITHSGIRPEVLERDLRALKLPGLDFRKETLTDPKTGLPASGLYVEITDWDAWRPTELNFYLMRLACKYDPRNPFATATKPVTKNFLHHLGSSEFLGDIVAHGAQVDVGAYIKDWEAKARVYQQQVRKYWIYN
jgi:uncharacterized protein YbbC (DUF1343 family)